MSFSWLEYVLLNTGNYQLTLGQVLTAIVILVMAFYASRLARKGVSRVSRLRNKDADSQIYVLNRFVHYLILVIGLSFALSVVGINMSKLAIVAGALGIGIGMGLQGLVNNFVSGIVILLEKSVKVGDFVQIDAEMSGIVKEINFRSTMIRNNDNVDVLVPNSELVANRVVNWTLEETRARFRIPFGVAYGSDKELVKKAVLEAADSVPDTLKDKGLAPAVWFTGFGDSSLDFTLGVWVDYDSVIRPTALKSNYLWAIDDAFRKYGIEIPFPQRDIYIKRHVAPEAKQEKEPETQD